MAHLRYNFKLRRGNLASAPAVQRRMALIIDKKEIKNENDKKYSPIGFGSDGYQL